ncbi:Quinone oxidoreductase-like-like-like protein [Cladobotryum mycophilum]|uniref:Quinone oxidoreductase-like-like-like protein n=1 Tax=Cladobotryum mycophilum TaxID=491253 RepID=A0ABR0SKG7_9HYPO
MRGIQIKEYVKSPKELTVTELPDPTPKDDDYVIQVSAAAANFFDILQVQGRYQNQPPFPWVAGAEFAGTVITTPRNLTNPRFPVGSRVFGAAQGAFATKLCVPEIGLLPVPEGWSFQDAAGLFVTAPTSYGALVVRANVKAGDWVLVHAAAGGVGLAAVQGTFFFFFFLDFTFTRLFSMAEYWESTARQGLRRHRHRHGFHPRKLEIAKAFGADHVISYNDADWPEQVRALTPKKRGVDIVYDPVGLVDKSTKCTAWNGRILVVGFAAGAIEKVAMNKVLLKNISIVGIHWGAYSIHERETIPKVWDGIMQLVKEGKIKGTEYTDEQFVGLERIKDALVALGSRGTWGKVVVKIPLEGGSKL